MKDLLRRFLRFFSGTTQKEERFRVFYCDYERDINQTTADSENLTVPEIVQLMRAILRADGNFLGLTDQNDLTLQFMAGPGDQVTIDVPVPRLGGSYSKRSTLDCACNLVKNLPASLGDTITSDMEFSGSIADHEYYANGRSKLHYLAYDVPQHHWHARVEQISEAGIDIDHRDQEGLSALHIGVLAKEVELVSTLLKAGANPNAPDKEGRTSLWWATDGFEGDLAIIRTLLSAGANVDSPDNRGQSPADLARKLSDPSLSFHFQDGTVQ